MKHFEIMTQDLENNLSVFIVFYRNKSFRLFLLCEKYILRFEIICFDQRNFWAVTAYMIILGTDDIPNILYLTRSTDKSETGMWCWSKWISGF